MLRAEKTFLLEAKLGTTGLRQSKKLGGNAGSHILSALARDSERNGFIEIIPGNWYFAVRCKSCEVQILFFPDENRGKRPVIVSMPVAVSCPHCKKDHSYDQTQISTVQAPES
jgi:hypothetical protein